MCEREKREKASQRKKRERANEREKRGGGIEKRGDIETERERLRERRTERTKGRKGERDRERESVSVCEVVTERELHEFVFTSYNIEQYHEDKKFCSKTHHLFMKKLYTVLKTNPIPLSYS